MTAAILAGGRATRMGGAEKAFLVVDGEAILDRQVRVLQPRFGEIVVAVAPGADTMKYSSRGLSVVIDQYQGSGPMAGLHAALEACKTEWLFAVAGDMPFLEGSIIDRIAGLAVGAHDADALVPLPNGRPEPLHAFYRAGIKAAAARSIESGRLAMTDLFDAIRTRYLDDRDVPGLSSSRSFSNLNTPEDLAGAAGRS